MRYFDDIEVGAAITVGEYLLKEDEIIQFAKVWDPQPFHVDPEAARRSPMGGITASACHVFCIAAWLMRKEEPVAVIAAAKHELELLHPARPGDRISKTVACLEKRPSKSKPDRGIAIFSTDMKTQNDVVFARIKTTLLLRRKPKG